MSEVDPITCAECGAVLWANPILGRQPGEPELKATGARAALTCATCGRINALSEIKDA